GGPDHPRDRPLRSLRDGIGSKLAAADDELVPELPAHRRPRRPRRRAGLAGMESTIIDSWRSEDGRRHDLDLHYDELVRNPPTYGHTPSYAFPWVSPAYSTHAAGDVVPAPASAPASWLVS